MMHGLILLIAFVLRIWGIHFGLPDLFHADEPIVVNHALHFGTGDFNPHFFNIPPLTSYLLFGVYGVFFLIGKILGLFSGSSDFAELFFRDPTAFYFLARVSLGVIPAVLSVHFLMKWLKSLGWQSWYISCAGILFAVNFIHVSDAHYVYADIPLVLVAILFFKALHSYDLSVLKNHFILGAYLGLGIAFKYNAVFLVLPYLWMMGLKPFSERLKNVSIAAISACVVFFLLNPFSLFDFHFFLRELREQSGANSGVPFFHHLMYSLNEGMTLPLLVLGLLGVVLAFLSKDIKKQSIAFFCVVYYLVLWEKGQPYGRYILLLVPFLIFLAVEAWYFLSQKWSKLHFLWAGWLVLAIALNLAKDIQFNRILSAWDTRTQAKTWIETHIQPGSRIALDGTSFSPRLNFDCARLENKKESLKREKHFSNAEEQRLNAKLKQCGEKAGYDLSFLSKSPGTTPFFFASPELEWKWNAIKEKSIQYVLVVPQNHEGVSEELAQLRSNARLIQVWDPYGQALDQPEKLDPQVITGGPFTWKDLWARKVNGYRLELYETDLVR